TFGIIFLCGNTAMREELLTKTHQLLKVIIQTVGSSFCLLGKRYPFIVKETNHALFVQKN
ncbi:hypothetical protein, partial [Bacillus subtilis]|uniref:hypothetical protein n=1 Tax=Bacillus subtilis TaxID=1423 RepID=UPI001ADD4253